MHVMSSVLGSYCWVCNGLFRLGKDQEWRPKRNTSVFRKLWEVCSDYSPLKQPIKHLLPHNPIFAYKNTWNWGNLFSGSGLVLMMPWHALKVPHVFAAFNYVFTTEHMTCHFRTLAKWGMRKERSSGQGRTWWTLQDLTCLSAFPEEGTMSPIGLKLQDPCMWALVLWDRHVESKARSCPVWTLLKSCGQRWSYKLRRWPRHGEEVAGSTGYSGDPRLDTVFLWRFPFEAFKKVRKLVSLFITPCSIIGRKDTYEKYMCIRYICSRCASHI